MQHTTEWRIRVKEKINRTLKKDSGSKLSPVQGTTSILPYNTKLM